ncbi:MAG: hypothetical protein WBD09_01880 [Halobacteriota archaeon]
MKIALLKSVTHIISMRKIMGRDQIVSNWEVAIPIKGNISFEQDKLKIDDLVFYHENNGKVFAKTTVKDRSENDASIEAIKRVNRVLDEIAFEQNASIRIERSGIKGSRISEPIGETTVGEITDAWIEFTVKLNHQINQNTLGNAARLVSDIQDEDKKRIFQKALSHYRNGLNAESDGNSNAFLDFWKSIEAIARHYDEGGCLFSWDNVTESDSKKLKKYLIDEFEIKWVKNAKIIKRDNDDGKTIHIFKDENSVEIRIDKKEKKALLITSNLRTHDLKVKKENGELNIYGNKIKDKIYDCFEKCFGERKDDEVNEFNKIRGEYAAHGSKNVSDPEEIKVMIEKTPQMKDLAREFLEAWSGQKAQNFESLS